ncbi:MAG: hypothetical protein NTW19_15395 [Planctomycetota bacterium]|nr:hypothetical protein [Planctomycetota bacterium]
MTPRQNVSAPLWPPHRPPHRPDDRSPAILVIALAIALTLAALLSAAGCQNAGLVTYENARTGEKVTVRQTPKSVAPATLRRGAIPSTAIATSSSAPNSARASASASNPTPGSAESTEPSASIEASTGQQQSRDFAAESQSRSLTWVGILLLMAGLGGTVLRIYLPAVPLSASLLAMGGGLLFLMLPGLLSHPVLLWAILGAVATLALIGWHDNRTKLRDVLSPLPPEAPRAATPETTAKSAANATTTATA